MLKDLYMDLSQISRTAILTLICRAVTSERNNDIINDPMAVFCLDGLISNTSAEDRRWITSKKRQYEGIRARDAKAGAKRAGVFDRITRQFIEVNPHCTVINLACGFDTRFWRIPHENCRYIELDLPAVIQLKKEILQDKIGYKSIGCSVLDTSWMDQMTLDGNTDFLLLAEGLFMWFPPQDAIRVFKEMGARFARSQLVLDMVPEKYTRGLWKKFIRWHSRIDWGLDVAWDFGIQEPRDMEAYGKGFKVIGVEKGSAGPTITVAINTT
jgi:O-methyltransferase involved in polyketide biosynthesis